MASGGQPAVGNGVISNDAPDGVLSGNCVAALSQPPSTGPLPVLPAVSWQPSVSYVGCSSSPMGSADKRVNLHFRVSYMTKWGQRLVLAGSGALLGNMRFSRGVSMRCHHEKDVLVWEALINLPWQQEYQYRYAIMADGEEGSEAVVAKTEGVTRRVALHPGLQHSDVVEIIDTWSDLSYPGSILSTCAFTKVIRRHSQPRLPSEPPRQVPVAGEAVVRFTVCDAMLENGQAVCVTGAVPQLGTWQQDQMLELTDVGDSCWEGEIRVPYAAFAFTYKYAVVSRAAGGSSTTSMLLEVGEPRVCGLPLAAGGPSTSAGPPAVIVRHDGHVRRDKLWRGAGLAIPVFSLRTQWSVGVGDFLDLTSLVDLADAAGMRLIQVLPVNDTCVYGDWQDSYPYSSLSVHALHPQYLSLAELFEDEEPEELGQRGSRNVPPDLARKVEEARLQLETAADSRWGEVVDYEGVMATKAAVSRDAFERVGARQMAGEAYKAWFETNKGWLKPYAAFCFLRDLFGTAEHWRWGDMATPSDELVERLTHPHREWHGSVACRYWVQWHLHRQLLRASRYAASRRVVLKGDLPIGVDKRSVDTWVAPHLFRMDKSTGAPPDFFATQGQNWGFPTYNWEAMAADGYAWWRSRLSHLATYFHAYRIDHVLGFCRIWEIPGDCATGMLGHFRPSHPITKRELEATGVWDLERLTQPYIRQHTLENAFEGDTELAADAAARYLLETQPGEYKFRPQYTSEKAIASISTRPDAPAWLQEQTATTRRALLGLRQNVVLLPDDKDPDAFYPRFGSSATSSFQELPARWRVALVRLHDDYYFKRQEQLWSSHALATLPALIGASDMLVCGEDLGFVPACLPPVMQELGLLGLRIQRMPTTSGVEFNDPADYTYLTVASPSCHDVAPLRAWWEEDPERSERFYYTQLSGAGPPPTHCNPGVARAVLQQHLSCPSALCILPVQDVMALVSRFSQRPAQQEVINDPTVPKHYWRYRMHVSVEELAADGELLALLQDMLLLSDRAKPSDLPQLGNS